MNQETNSKWDAIRRILPKTLTHLLVAVLASALTFGIVLSNPSLQSSKLNELEKLIERCFIGQEDKTAMQDAAASAMVEALGDRWSYYIPADEYESYKEQMKNEYVGIGVTISGEEKEDGYEVIQVEPAGGAAQAGILVGDVITHVEGQSVKELGMDATKNLIRGQKNTKVAVTVRRGEQELVLEIMRQTIKVTVAKGQMLPGKIGLVSIANFDERCAQETLEQIDKLVEQGAESLIFDVRYNPGGYKKELVKILDYLLPEGDLFRSLSYTGEESVDKSDANCLEMPMAVLLNESSYSAAEFFAAALNEYDWAVLIGQPTVGKSYFQNTFELSDGSAVGLSVGKYFTPNGVSLAEEGGLQPEILVEVDETTAAKIYAGQLLPGEDPQIQAAVEALKSGKKS